jgi:hypothetical protein
MPARKVERGLRLAVRVQPRASRNELGGVVGEGQEARVALKLTAPPVEGAANKAAREFLAEAFGVAKSAVALVAGEKAREKVFEIGGDPERLWSRFQEITRNRA